MSGDITPDGKYMTFGRNGDIYWVSTSFIEELRHTNFVPYLKSTLKAQTDTMYHSFKFQLADSVFVDDDGNNTLTYSATLDDGSSLPSWLTFDPVTKTLSGIPNTAGTFKLKITVTDTAMASALATFNLVVKETPASSNQIGDQYVSVFPNPTTNRFEINFGSSPLHRASVEIFNLLGNRVFSKTFQNATSETIDLTGQPKGIYLIKSCTGGVSYNQKVCIE